jgi:hypothetical protein
MKSQSIDSTRDIEKELRAAELLAMEYESQVQSGEADAIDDTSKLRAQMARERARVIGKETSDWEWVLSDVRGLRVIYRILSIMGPNRISHVPGDPYSTAFNEGKRSAANDVIERILAADAGAYHRMQRNHSSDLKSELERKRVEKEAEQRKEK